MVPVTTEVDVLDDGRFLHVSPSASDARVTLRNARGRAIWEVDGLSLLGREGAAVFDRPFSWPPATWEVASWIDEPQCLVFVIAGNSTCEKDFVAAADLASGRPVHLEDPRLRLLCSLDRPAPSGKLAVLDLALDERWPEAVDPARRILQDPDQPVRLRFRAALILLAFGDTSGAESVLEMCYVDTRDWRSREDMKRAWRALGQFLGEDAAAICRSVLDQAEPPVDRLRAALACLGSGAMQASVDVLLDWVCAGVPDDRRFFEASEPLARLRKGTHWDVRYQPGVNDREDLPDVWSQARSGSSAAVAMLLSRVQPDDGPPEWSEFLPAVLRQVRHTPCPPLAAPIRSFLASFTANPDGTPEWQALVVAEADAALDAIQALR
jgi:hypothetical protein